MTGKLRGAHVENVEGVPKVEVDWIGGEMGKAERELVRGERTGAEAEAAVRRLYFKELPLSGNKANAYMCLIVGAS